MIRNILPVVLADSESLLEFYKTGKIISIAFTALFFVLSIVLFFVFDVRGIFNIKSGRAEKRKVKQMEETNASTGRLLSSSSRPGNTGHFSEKLNAIKNTTSVQQPVVSQAPPQPLVANLQQTYMPPEPQAQPAYAPQQSSAANYSESAGTDETSLLSRKVKVTQVSNTPEPASTPGSVPTPVPTPAPAPAVSAANAPQPVHHLATADELGKSAAAIQFKMGDGETSRLDESQASVFKAKEKADTYKFIIKRNLMLVHTTEVIQ